VNRHKLHEGVKQPFTVHSAPLAQVPVFLEVAKKRGFTAAARALRISTSAASQAVARLEQELGVTLLIRTTRSVSLTLAGERLLADIEPALNVAAAALSAVRVGSEDPSGVLRFTVPRVACRIGLLPVLSEFARRYPAVQVDVVVDDRPIDLVREGFDAGIRPERALQKDMIRIRLSRPLRMVVVGSKRYFVVHGRPTHPRQLSSHACLGWRKSDGGGAYRWEFSERGRQLEVAVNGPLLANDVELLLAAAETDLGLAFVAECEAAQQIASGRLESVLDDYSVKLEGLFLYFPRAARNVPKLRAFIECVREVAGGA